MTVQSGQSVIQLFTTRAFATGVATNATGTPTGTLYLNGASNAAAVTVTNLSTGVYTASVTLPTLAVNDGVELIIAATVAGVSDNAVIWGDSKDLAASAGIVSSNTTQLAGQTVTAAAGVTFPTSVASPTNITAGTITNLTNAPTAGDFTATMKTSLNASTPSSVTTVTGNVNGSVGSVTGAVAITSNTKRTQALANYPFLMTDNVNHAPMTGLTVTATRSLDGVAFAPCVNAVSEISNGWYKISLASTDMNANNVALRFTATGADDRDQTIVTQP